RIGPSQRVICVDGEMMGHSLAEADVHAVVVRPADRLVVTNACELRQRSPWRSKSVQRSRAANTTHRHALIDIDGFVFVKTENMRVFCLNHGVGVERPAIPAVKLQGLRVAIVGVHQTPYAAWRKLRGRRRNRRKWANTVLPLAKRLPRTWNRVARVSKAEHRCKDRRVAHLFHE